MSKNIQIPNSNAVTGSTQKNWFKFLSSFENKNYRYFWTFGTMSYVNRWLEITTVSWLVLELTNSPLQMGLVGIFRWLPMLLIGPITGTIADRLNRKYLLMTTLLVNCLTSAGLAYLIFFNLIEVWHLAFGTAIVGLTWSLDYPSRRPLLMDIAGEHKLVNAIALDSGSMTGSKIVGPLVAGILIGSLGVGWAYLLICILYIISLGFLSNVKIEIKNKVKFGPIFTNAIQGIKYSIKTPSISKVLLITIVMNILLFPYVQFIPAVAKNVLSVGPSLMGLLMSADGFGSLIGALIIASLTIENKVYGRIFILGTMISLIFLLLFSLTSNFLVCFALLMLMGIGLAGFGTMQSLIILISCSPNMRGRAMGILGLAIGMQPFGLVFIGYLAEILGPPFAILISSLIGLALTSIILTKSSQLWTLNSTKIEYL